MQYQILCTYTIVNIGIPISKTAPETYFAEGLTMTCYQVETCSLHTAINIVALTCIVQFVFIALEHFVILSFKLLTDSQHNCMKYQLL